MADFCKKHSEQMWGFDSGDASNLCQEGYVIEFLCEGCGEVVLVDHNGNKMIWDDDSQSYIVDENISQL